MGRKTTNNTDGDTKQPINIMAEIKDITKSQGPFLAMGLVIKETAHLFKNGVSAKTWVQRKVHIKKAKVSFPKELRKTFLNPISGIIPIAAIHNKLGQSIATVSHNNKLPKNIPITFIPNGFIPVGSGRCFTNKIKINARKIYEYLFTLLADINFSPFIFQQYNSV